MADPNRPKRSRLALCSGVLHSIIDGIADAGHLSIGDVICWDTDKTVRRAGRMELVRSQQRHPQRISQDAIHDSYGRINPGVTTITDDGLRSLGHVDLVIATPE